MKIRLPEIPIKEEIVRFITDKKSERIAEIPLVLQHIPDKNNKIVDIGCRYSLLSIQLAAIGNEVHGVDVNSYRYRHPNFKFHRKDIIKLRGYDSYFDIAISLSTIEHIGLDFYGEGFDKNGDVKAIGKIYSLLKKGGILLMSAPFGKSNDSSWYRVYNHQRLNNLLKKFKIEKIKIFRKVKDYWQNSSIKECEHLDNGKSVNSIFFVMAKK